VWSELLYPREWPLSHHEFSYLLPHLLKTGRGRIDTYFTRVYNPVWTNPDGAMWIEALSDEALVGCHAALTPTWNETARWADFVLPMGHATERHDLMSQETHAARGSASANRCIACSPNGRASRSRGPTRQSRRGLGRGRVLDRAVVGSRSRRLARHPQALRVAVPQGRAHHDRRVLPLDLRELGAGPARRRREGRGSTPLEYMRRHGCFLVQDQVYKTHEAALPAGEYEIDAARGTVAQNGKVVGVYADGKACVGFPTPSKKLELYSQTMTDWGWPEYSTPVYVKSHIDESQLDRSQNEMVLVATFRLPTLIHTRSANSKWLTELSNTNPVWIHPTDAARLGIEMGDLLRVASQTGYYVNAAWVTEGVRPGVIACSHHMGRWTVKGDAVAGNHWQLHDVDLRKVTDTAYLMRRVKPVGKFASNDPDSDKVWWESGGVHQNMTFPAQPDPVSGMHCWHQKVVVTKAEPGDRYGDVYTDTAKSMEVFEQWLAKARPAGEHGTGGLRRPLHLRRVCRPTDGAFQL
jgi:anaerobic selenocysteine-containing dehydrogenase